MLARLVERKDAISLILSSTEIVPNLLPHEWLTAAEYFKTLQSFEEATELMSRSRYLTLSMVIHVLNLLCDQLADNKTSTLNDLRIALSAKIKTRWPDYEQDLTFSIACLVDPRFGKFAFDSQDALKKAYDTVIERMENERLKEQAQSVSLSLSSLLLHLRWLVQLLVQVLLNQRQQV